MSEPEQNPTEQPEPTKPEFKPPYFWAFATLMLHKLGGTQAITIDRLEQFDIDSVPEVYYDGDKNAWVMRLKDKNMPAKPIIVPVGNKILKRQRKILRGRLS
jgi:hypothetical protein